MSEGNSIFCLRKSTSCKPEFEVPSSEKNYVINIKIENSNVKGATLNSEIFSRIDWRFDLDRGIRGDI